MKKIAFIICAAFLIMSFISSNHFKSGIHGIIDPADAAKKVWAISGTDSVSTTLATESFSIELKPGTWTLVVEAVKPYKSALIENIMVTEGESVDAGTIKLKKE